MKPVISVHFQSHR